MSYQVGAPWLKTFSIHILVRHINVMKESKNVLVTIPFTSKAAKGSIFERMLAKSNSMAGLKSHASVPDLCTKKERKTKSSGYGKSFEVKMFQPMINSRYANYQQCYALQTI